MSPDEDSLSAPAPAPAINASMNVFLGHLQSQIHERISADLDVTLSEFREEMKRIASAQVAITLKETDVLRVALKDELGEMGLMEDGVVKGGSISPAKVEGLFQNLLESPSFADAVDARCSGLSSDVATLNSRVGELEQRVIDDLLMDLDHAAEHMEPIDDDDDDADEAEVERAPVTVDDAKIVAKEVQEEAEARAKQEAEEKAKQEAEEKAKQEAEEKAKQEAEEKAKQEAEEKAKQEAEEKAKQEAEEKAKLEAMQRAKEEADAKAKLEAELKAKEEVFAKLEAELKAKEDAAAKAQLEAELKAKDEAVAKLVAELKAKEEEAERKAKEETERKAKEEAEAKAREEAKAKNLDIGEEKKEHGTNLTKIGEDEISTDETPPRRAKISNSILEKVRKWAQSVTNTGRKRTASMFAQAAIQEVRL